jgi:hypothetical protein
MDKKIRFGVRGDAENLGVKGISLFYQPIPRRTISLEHG